MAICKHCGQEVPSYAKFCPKCGMADPVDNPTEAPEAPPPVVAPPAPSAPPAPRTEKKPLDFGWFNKNFLIFFIISGALAYGFTELCGTYISTGVSFGFGIALGVFALIFAVVFLAVGIIGFLLSFGKSGEQRQATRTRDIVCFVIAIAGFVFVLLTCIAVFIYGSDMNDVSSALGSLFG